MENGGKVIIDVAKLSPEKVMRVINRRYRFDESMLEKLVNDDESSSFR